MLFILLSGHLIVRFLQVEWWPFSNYPMYSSIFKPEKIYYHEIWLVDLNDKERKASVLKHFFPYTDRSLEEVFFYHLSTEKRQTIIQALHRWYERQAAIRIWPKIKHLRLYKFEYDFENSLSNKNDQEYLQSVRNKPVTRTLLHESTND